MADKIVDYTTIQSPYDNELNRVDPDIVDLGSGESGSEATTASNNDASSSADGSKSTSSATQITSGNQFDDIFLSSSIRSTNYLPKSRGFLIDGMKGYIEAIDMYLSGTIHATAGDITGTLTVGSGTPSILIDGVNAQIGTSPFVSGQSGWRIDADGTAEFSNIIARGEFRTAVFVKDEVHASGGSLLVLGASVLLADLVTVTTPTTSTMDVKDPPSGHTQLFAVNDIVRIKDGSGKDNWLKITAASDQTTFYRYTVDKQSGTNGTFYAGTAVINYKQATDGFILMTSDMTNAPYIDIGISGATPWTSTTNKVRIGNLAGITSANFGSLTGYGIWTDSGYFEGSIAGTTITGGTIQTATSGQRIRIIASAGTTPTQGANSFGLIDTNNNLLISFGSDTGAGDYLAKIVVPASPTGANTGLYVSNASNTSTRTAYFGRNNTDATGQNVLMEQAGTGTNLKVDCVNDASSGTGIHLDYAAIGTALKIDVTNADAYGPVAWITNYGLGYGLYLVHSPPTGTLANAAYIASSDDSANNALRVYCSHPGNTAAPLHLQTGGTLATNFKKLIRGNSHTIWESDGTTPNGNLDIVQGVMAGDICIGADSGKTYYCTNAAEPGAWTAM